MSKIYDDLAEVYEAMYYSFIDYKEEYEYYRQIIQQYHKNEVLEIGCGTGSLAKYYLENEFSYQGLDISSQMIAIAQRKNPKGHFIEGNMCDFQLPAPTESAIITGLSLIHI